MIVLFTDFGLEGPYVGQVKAVLCRGAPGVPVIDLFSDLAPFDARSAAYLLAAYAVDFPAGTVFLCVVDPGVGGGRGALVVRSNARWYVGPDNGLFEPLLRRDPHAQVWQIVSAPGRLSATFHGRDLFAPVAAGVARGDAPEALGCRACPPPRRPDWPDELGAVVYIDRYGNAMTGLRAAMVDPKARLLVESREVAYARTYSEVPVGVPLWYENANGLVEIGVNQGRADRDLKLVVGSDVAIVGA